MFVGAVVGGRTTSVVLYGRFVQVARDAHFIELKFVFEGLQAQDGHGPCWNDACAIEPFGDGSFAAL